MRATDALGLGYGRVLALARVIGQIQPHGLRVDDIRIEVPAPWRSEPSGRLLPWLACW